MESRIESLDWSNVPEIDIVYSTKVKVSERPLVECSSDIYPLLLSKWNMNHIELQEEKRMIIITYCR